LDVSFFWHSKEGRNESCGEKKKKKKKKKREGEVPLLGGGGKEGKGRSFPFETEPEEALKKREGGKGDRSNTS